MAQSTWSTPSSVPEDRSRSSTLVAVDARVELIAHLRQLYGDLFAVFRRDPEQEVLGIALPVLDAILAAARTHLASCDSAIDLATTMADPISLHTVGEAVPVRALDAWLVVGQLLAALGDCRAPSLTGDTPTFPDTTTIPINESTNGSERAKFA